MTKPIAPSALSATVISYSEIDLKWKDNATNETGFNIERQVGTGSFALLMTASANVTASKDTTVQPLTMYSYRINAFNASGTSSYTNVASGSTPTAQPAAPSALVATAVNYGLVNVVWQDNSSNETNFIVERQQGTGSFVTVATFGANATGSNLSVFSNAVYTFRVRATNAVTSSDYSNLSTVTVPAAPLSRVAVSPASFSLAPLATHSVSATAYDAQGVVMSDSVFVWSLSVSSSVTDASVDQSGLFTAGAQTGSAIVIATTSSFWSAQTIATIQ